MHLTRKHFIKTGSLTAAGGLLIPKFLQNLYAQVPQMPAEKILIVIQLSGGNDGLNTVVPITNDIYYKQRPGLAIDAKSANRLTDEVGLHPALPFFKEAYQAGELAIINSVGYPNPNRSHFRSMDIWQSGSSAQQYWQTGWLGRYLDAQCNACQKPTQLLELDDVLSLALKGKQAKGLAFENAERLYKSSRSGFLQQISANHQPEHTIVDYLYKTLDNSLQSAEQIFKASKQPETLDGFPDTALGKHLKIISSLIKSDLNTRVYYVSHGSFDTHVGQAFRQGRLLKELNDSVEALVLALKKSNQFKEVLIMTFSEFGRRVGQNASGGTDHGTANNMMMIGGGLKKPGLYNSLPNLQQLDEGDLRYEVDFRQVYATILDRWLHQDASTVLNAQFAPLNFL